MLETLAAALMAIQSAPGTTAPPAAPPAQPSAAAVAGKTLKELPGLTIRYFDVTGKNLKAINASIARQQQADPSGRIAAPASAWAVNTTFKKLTSAGQCKIVGAKATFTATANLPRLMSNRAHKPELLTAWRNYLADIENVQAANLWFVYDNMRDVERAILASSCEGAQAAGGAAVTLLRAKAADFQRANAAPVPAAPAAAPAGKK
ncbi:MAG: DUF922 domain-containing protein [Sphingomonas sp.]|nr:DUF922 domain-containing protein [Sphingomonas sp.]